MSLVVNVAGQAENISVVRSLDKDLDKNAIAALGRWKFKPGEQDGKPVPVAATVELKFRLQ